MSITTHSAAESRRLGERLGLLLRKGDVVFLTGDLGTGKTTFTKGVARGLGVSHEVTSPTFTLVAEYEGRVPVAHMDLYRLLEERSAPTAADPSTTATDAAGPTATEGGGAVDPPAPGPGAGPGGSVSDLDLEAIGVDDYLSGNHAVLIEWPAQLAEQVDDALHIHITTLPLPRIDEREFRCTSTGSRSWEVLDEWVKEWLF